MSQMTLEDPAAVIRRILASFILLLLGAIDVAILS
jgi:hypothetical protein